MSEEALSNDLKENVKDTNVWLRLLYMLLFVIIYSVAEVVLAVVIFFQFLSVLFTGNKNEKVLSLGSQLSTFVYQVFSYLTYNSEVRPFPFSDWPSDVTLCEPAVEKKPARKAASTRKRAPVKKKATATKPREASQEEKPVDTD